MRESAKTAYCGLYCPMCSHLAAAETKDREHMLALPECYDHLKQRTFAECECAGCKDQVDKCHCEMKPCAEKREITSCADCRDFPCSIIEAFGNDGAPHHAEALRNLWRIKEVGHGQWLKEMEARMYCVCGARQSWYHYCPVHSDVENLK